MYIMAKMAITVSTEGVQVISFLCTSEDDRRTGLKIYAALEEELRVIDQLVKEHFAKEKREGGSLEP